MTSYCPHCDETTPHTIEKYCPACEKTLPHMAFYRNKAQPSGLSSYCRTCTNATHHAAETLAKRRQRRAVAPTNHRIGRPLSLPRDEAGSVLITKKYCPQCQLTKPTSEFHRNASQPDGLHGWCKVCRNAIHKLPKEQEKRRLLHRDWYEANQEHSCDYAQQWRSDNPERVKEHGHKRRARKNHAPINDLTAAQWKAIKEHFDHRCVYCGKKFKRLTQDHITPLSLGGSHTVHNVVPACHSCNSRKKQGPVLIPVQPLLLVY